jgi:hypothetical protein
MTEDDRLTPSLLEPQSRGGDIAEGGFSFQDHIILARIPVWLAREGFTAMVKESIGDVEAKFFVPGRGFVKDLIEVKDHVLQPSEFWSEVKRFQKIDAGSPDTYRSFTLIGTGASKALQPLINGLDRVRGSQDFYEERDGVKSNSTQEYARLIQSKGRTEQDALFILEKVIVETDWNTAKTYGEAVFKQSLADHLEEYGDFSAKTIDNIYNHLATFVRHKKNRTITRKELEKELREKIPSHQQPAHRSILIYTAISPEDNPTHPGLRFDWTPFSGGETRAIAPSEQWDRLLIELQYARTWIENYRNTKRIKLLGNRRVPACLALGSVFSAVRGYAIEMEYRSEIWATDSYPTAGTSPYSLDNQMLGDRGDRLVVSISICTRSILSEVQANLERFELSDAPLLDIRGEQPITSPEQANVVAGSVKKIIVQNLPPYGSRTIHLFYGGPAHLALFLGHRLDATAPIVCYGWAGTQYSRTCQLFSGRCTTER